MNLIGLALAGYALAVLSWLFYLAIMHLKRVRDDLHPVAKAHAYLLLSAGLVLDVVLNAVVGSVLFLEPPRELLLTSRLKRLKRGDGWRAKLADWVCEHLLEQFDEGHCG